MVKYRYKNKIDMKEILEFQDVRCDLWCIKWSSISLYFHVHKHVSYFPLLFQMFRFPLSITIFHLFVKFLLALFFRTLWELKTGKERVLLSWDLYVKKVAPTGKFLSYCMILAWEKNSFSDKLSYVECSAIALGEGVGLRIFLREEFYHGEAEVWFWKWGLAAFCVFVFLWSKSDCHI
jgi:hypothetical protein